ncbi:MAG TPA: NADH-quinone oxidoreductase subunit A [Thermodesulfovibrio thiophilus]|uniref:NADH-quinone oxidoreductase subunit A n=1 Tax=Thermodesulfovibrio thiophilus TaxID=340095 RepID=UPI00040B73E4|nr:NADH-quinone oxidoreductase subunit A [Thermodesulfovibrio thiophilus]HOA82386.1 NADH-quinone oxidoreductase subunit A [Thermodesulfovibrio thiophilus]HQD35811.1 NADH-quinone oxidoreductase subunit A [Thermodesulfovibrio thiophilus]
MEPGSWMPYKYLPVLIALILATLFGLGGLILNKIFAPRRFNPVKFIPYESGNLPSGLPKERFFIGFFLLAILFVVFDVEVIFLYPWAVAFDFISDEGFWVMLFFIGLILIGYIYEILIGALTWHRK